MPNKMDTGFDSEGTCMATLERPRSPLALAATRLGAGVLATVALAAAGAIPTGEAWAHATDVASAAAGSAVGEGDEGSLNVRRVGRIALPGTQAIAFSSKAPLAYVSARRNGGVVATFDISDPAAPKKLGEISVPSPVYQEDMNLGERPDGTTFVLVRGSGSGLQIVDVTNPTKPRRRGDPVPANAHTWTCTSPECYYAYGSGVAYSPENQEFPVVDLRDLDAPKSTPVESRGRLFHDWNRDSSGIMWAAGTGMGGLFAFDATSPTAPRLLNTSDWNGVRGFSEYNDLLQLHGSLRPNPQRFVADLRPFASVHSGNVLLVSEEGDDQDCTDSFQTWYIPHLDPARYQAENPHGLIGGGTITPLDNWSLLKDTTPGESRPMTGQWCSVHWFDYHQDGFVVLAAYDNGTHVLDVNDADDIRQVGYHFTAHNTALQSYWVPKRDRRGRTTGEASTLAYTADSGDGSRIVLGQEPISGGIDIFQVALPE